MLALLCLAACSAGSEAPRRYNVLLVSIDTLRADHLAPYGYARPTAPFLENLAQQAVLFEHAYAHASFTLSSHMSMFTSLFPAAHGVDRGRKLSSLVPTLPELLQSAGYETVGFYTQEWLTARFGFSRGFSVYERRRDGPDVEEGAVSFLRSREARRETPFFLFLHFRDVHASPRMNEPGRPIYDSPPEFRDAFLPYPDLGIHYRGRDVYFEKFELSDPELANMIARYDGGILYVDSILERLIGEMGGMGLLDDTLIIVTSDHGEALGDRGKIEGHGRFWEEGLRVPLIVRLPDAHAESDRWRGVRLGHRVQSVDIPPTILDFAAVPAPASFQGASLLDARPRDVIAHRRNTSVLIRGRHKLKLVRDRAELYDLVDDPGETRRIEWREPELTAVLVRDLSAVIEEHESYQRKTADPEDAPVELSEDEEENLRALGYLE